MSYVRQCDCVDYRSESADRIEAERKREQEEWQKDFEERMKEIRKVVSVDEAERRKREFIERWED